MLRSCNNRLCIIHNPAFRLQSYSCSEKYFTLWVWMGWADGGLYCVHRCIGLLNSAYK